MVKTKATKEETLAKFQAAREKKRVCLAKLEKSMKETYKKRTGKEADTFFALWNSFFHWNTLTKILHIR